MASGGPYFGFFSTRMAHVRQMPGRLVGQTVDKEGTIGFSLTLQAREQHIRRAKATSNICTNQGLLVTAATIHMSLLGAEGLRQVALACHHNTHQLVQELTQIPGVEQQFSAPMFHEVLLKIDYPCDQLLQKLAAAGIAGGYIPSDSYPQLNNTLLVCATEMRTPEEITHYATTLNAIMATR
jgi:glycine dehydrogenase subunit 1